MPLIGDDGSCAVVPEGRATESVLALISFAMPARAASGHARARRKTTATIEQRGATAMLIRKNVAETALLPPIAVAPLLFQYPVFKILVRTVSHQTAIVEVVPNTKPLLVEKSFYLAIDNKADYMMLVIRLDARWLRRRFGAGKARLRRAACGLRTGSQHANEQGGNEGGKWNTETLRCSHAMPPGRRKRDLAEDARGQGGGCKDARRNSPFVEHAGRFAARDLALAFSLGLR